ncbi:MAG: hypothetical protein ACTHN5_02730 [Phycisphaerae bacterium]
MGVGTRIIGAALAIAASAAAASASSLPITAVLFNTNDTPKGVQPGTTSLTVQFGTTSMANAFVGQLNWYSAGPAANLSDGLNPNLQSILTSDGSHTGMFSTYCIEGLQDVYFGSSETWNLGVVDVSSAPTPGAAMGSVKAGELTELWNRYHDTVGTDDEKGAAFQLAVWEIVNDGIPTLGGASATDFTTGDFQAMGDSIAINQAVNWLNGITGGGYTQTYTLFALSDRGIQDQIFAVTSPNGGTNPVPLPSALPAGLALMAGLGIVKFVRRRSF